MRSVGVKTPFYTAGDVYKRQGLNTYGTKVVRPGELVVLEVAAYA